MTEVSRTVDAAPEHVFAVLADGWSYAAWVVGNSHVREVDPDWPAVGTRIHHSFGLWPLQFKDQTEVKAMTPNRLLELRARLLPFGAATVRIELAPTATGGTRVVMGEQADRGPGSLIPDAVQALLLRPRNIEAIGRLGDLARGRAQAVQP